MTESTDNAHWIDAHRYLLGEMSAEEVIQFEALLAAGGGACDALAEAVLLQGAVQACCRSSSSVAPALPASRVGSTGRSKLFFWARGRLAWVGGCVAVVLAGVALVRLVPSSPGEGVAMQPFESQEQLISVAEVWSRLQPETRDEVSFGLEDGEDLDWLSPTVDVPDWMLAAVDAEELSEQDQMPVDSGPGEAL